MRVLDQYVLVKQIMKKKTSLILMDAAKSSRDAHDFSFTVIQKGDKCERNIDIGEHPIFSEYVKFTGLKVIKKTKLGMISHVIVHENDIIGVDDDVININDDDIGDEEDKSNSN